MIYDFSLKAFYKTKITTKMGQIYKGTRMNNLSVWVTEVGIMAAGKNFRCQILELRMGKTFIVYVGTKNTRCYLLR